MACAAEQPAAQRRKHPAAALEGRLLCCNRRDDRIREAVLASKWQMHQACRQFVVDRAPQLEQWQCQQQHQHSPHLLVSTWGKSKSEQSR